MIKGLILTILFYIPITIVDINYFFKKKNENKTQKAQLSSYNYDDIVGICLEDYVNPSNNYFLGIEDALLESINNKEFVKKKLSKKDFKDKITDNLKKYNFLTNNRHEITLKESIKSPIEFFKGVTLNDLKDIEPIIIIYFKNKERYIFETNYYKEEHRLIINSIKTLFNKRNTKRKVINYYQKQDGVYEKDEYYL